MAHKSRDSRRPRSALRALLTSEAGGGLVLMAAAALALALANSPASGVYDRLFHLPLGPMSLLHWINDALMALFFLLVGLEIKREFLDGQLASPRRRMLPAVAAAGGMAVPALIYVLINQGHSEALRGWAVPTATDIAFALGVLALLGRRVPASLKIFLTALAIIDDLGAVAIIAVFYTKQLAFGWLTLALLLLLLLALLNRAGVQKLLPYLLLGLLLWLCTWMSGVHATLAGVGLALAIPLRISPGRPDDPASPLHRLEHALQPSVAYLVVPLFGFANAGLDLAGLGWAEASATVTLGVAGGLFLGKLIGVFGASWLAIRYGLADRPEDASQLQMFGLAALCGIGFTMSLFIGMLAFDTPALLAKVKLGVLGGSLVSALFGLAVLRFAHGGRPVRA